MYSPTVGADPIPPNTEITIQDQDFSSSTSIPNNIVLGNCLSSHTNATISYNSSAGAIEYKTVGDQVGSMFVGIEPFINGNLSISLKLSSDSTYANVYIIGSTFEIRTYTLSDGSAIVYSLYDDNPASEGPDTDLAQYYIVPASALTNGVNTINIMISGVTRTLTVFHDSTHRMTTPMSDWSVQKLPYDPITLPLIEFENEKSSVSTWVSTMLFHLSETVSGGLVSAVPGNDLVPFGIDYPNNRDNFNGTQYMIGLGERGVAWVDMGWLEWLGQPLVNFTMSLLDAGWELGLHYNESLTGLPIDEAETLMQTQYDQVQNIFGRPPTSWCSYQNGDNATNAIFAYQQLGMIWRNGYSGISFLPDVGNLEETWWNSFWSNISHSQMVYPSFTHATDGPVAQPYAMNYQDFTTWVNNYDGKQIVGFNEYCERVMNQIDTKISYLEYVPGEILNFSVECNEFKTRLVIEFPDAQNSTMKVNGIPLVEGPDYSLVDADHIAIYCNSTDQVEIRATGAPNAPLNLEASSGNAKVGLSWSAPSNHGSGSISNYRIYRGLESGSEVLLTTLGNVLTYNDTGLTNGQTLFYRVCAVNSIGAGPLSIEVNATPSLADALPSAPNFLSAVSGDAQASLTWSAPGSNGQSPIIGYDVYRGTASGAETLLTTLGDVLTYTDVGLIDGQTYYYKVSAVNSVGEGAKSNEISATPASVPSGDYSYQLINGGTAIQITAYRGLGGAVTTPSEIGGIPVTRIGDYAFQKITTLTSLTISNGVTVIGKGAFCYCSALTNISIPSSVTTLSSYAFYGCTLVTSVTIPGSVAFIGDYAFYHLTALTSLTISNGVRGIGNTTFSYCSSLTSLVIPGSVTFIGSYAFLSCTALTAVSIPSSVTTISDHAFKQCTALTSVTIPGGVAYVGDYVFQQCSSLSSLTISSGVTTIGVGAFCYCSALTSVTIPGSVTSIGNYGFYYCSGLTQMTFQGNAPTCGTSWIAGHNANLVIYYYNGASGFTTPTWNGVSTVALYTPSSPRAFTVTAGNAQNVLAWTAPSSNGGAAIAHYKVYRGTIAGGESLLATLGLVLTYVDTGLTNGQTYYYKVSAVNSVGEGSLSNEAWATPATLPSVPETLTASVIDGQVALTWSAPTSNGGSSITNFKVYRGIDSGGETLLTTLGSVLNYTDVGAIDGQTYYYKVSAVNSVGESSQSNEASATPASLPSVPLDLQAVPDISRIILTWNAPTSNGGATITYYNVYRGLTAGGESLLITLDNVLSYVDATLLDGQTYYYTVTAVNGIGEGPQSNEVNATPTLIVSLPSAPNLNSVVFGNSQVTLIWNAPSSNGGAAISEYRVYRGANASEETLLDMIGNVLTYVDVSIEAGQTYYYRVSAVNVVGEGPLSNEMNTTSVVAVQRPSAPIIVSALQDNAQITLTWAAPSSDGGSAITNYEVYRGTASGEETLFITLGNVLTYTDTGLINGQTYYYKVTAVNSVGEGPLSNERSATPVTVCNAPQNLVAASSSGQIALSWASPSSNGGSMITNYNVYRGTASGAETLLTTLGNVLAYTDTGLINGQTYYYKVTAVNSVGEGLQSDEASGTPANAPSAPQTLAATASDRRVALTWSAPGSNGGSPITNYKVYRGTFTGGETLFITLGNVLTFTDVGLIDGQTYYYKVSAVNSVGEGSLSSEISATPASVPSGDYSYQLINGGTAIQITAYRGLGGAVTTPSEIGGIPVTRIGDYAFQKITTLTSLTISNGVTVIGKGAFCYCSALTSVVIPGSLTTLTSYAFYGCTHLTSVTIPGSVAFIGDYAFYMLTALTSLTISDGVRGIGNTTFSYCSSLTSVTIPGSATSIGSYAFLSCTALTTVNIPSSVTTISDHAFKQCTALTSVTIPGGVAYVGDYAFQQCSSLASLTISSGVTTIGVGAFCYCSALTSVTVPGSVTSIGNYAFYYCSGLTQMTFQGNAPTCGTSWIAGHNANLVIYYYNGASGFTTPTWNGIPTRVL